MLADEIKIRHKRNTEYHALRSPTDISFFLESDYCKNAHIASYFYKLFKTKKDWDNAVLLLAAGRQLTPGFTKYMSVRNPLESVILGKRLTDQIVSFYHSDMAQDDLQTSIEGLSETAICDRVLSTFAYDYLTFLNNVVEASIEQIKDWMVKNKSDLIGMDFSGLDLSGIDLSHANLIGTDLKDCILNNAILTNADLSQASLIGTELINANLEGSALISATLINTNLRHANLSNADLSFSFQQSIYAVETNFSSANFTDSAVKGGNYIRANLEGANLGTADISGAGFDGANLKDTVLCSYETDQELIYFNTDNYDDDEDENLFRR